MKTWGGECQAQEEDGAKGARPVLDLGGWGPGRESQVDQRLQAPADSSITATPVIQKLPGLSHLALVGGLVPSLRSPL